jgi:tetratricopeptide (TPR) repeat protein
MRANRLKILFILPIILLPFKLFATSETGGVDNIFSYGVGLRAIGMGGAFTAVKEDATLAYWNPGAMAFNQYKEVTVFGTRTIADTYYFAGFYTNPTVNFGTLSVGGLGLYTGGIQSYDENALPITGVSTDYFHYQILLSYGYNFPFGLGVGATGKIEQMNITEYTGTGGSLDLGVYYNPEPIPWLSVGAVVQDVIGTGIQIASEIEQNTRIYKLGVAGTFNLGEESPITSLKVIPPRLIVALDGRFYWDNYNPGTPQLLYDFSLGAEISFNDFIMLRVGYRNFSFEDIFQNLPAGLSVGFGIRQWGVTLDYAVTFEDPTWQGPADLLMQLGLSYRFGKSVKEQIQIKNEEEARTANWKDREKYWKVWQKDEEIKKIKESHDEEIKRVNEHYNGEINKITESYEEKIRRLTDNIGTLNEEIDKLTEEMKTLNTENKSEIGRLTDEISKRNEQISKLNEDIRNIKGTYEETTAKIKETSELYSSGLKLFYDGNYQEALKVFEQVDETGIEPPPDLKDYINLTRAAMVDKTTYPPEVLNIYNSGVALFVQKKYEEAITEWEKIYKIQGQEYNKLARDGIKQARDRLSKLKQLGAGE